jgi:MoxR-like ATPase
MDDSDASRTRPGLAPAHGLPPDATAPVPTISAVDALGLTVAPSPAVAVLPDATRAELAMLASAVRSAPPRPMSPTMSGRISSAIIVVDAAASGAPSSLMAVDQARAVLHEAYGRPAVAAPNPETVPTIPVAPIAVAAPPQLAPITFAAPPPPAPTAPAATTPPAPTMAPAAASPAPAAAPEPVAAPSVASAHLRELTAAVERDSAFLDKVAAEVGKVVVGQHHLVQRVLISLLTGGHCLIEGVPGLAKTLTVKTLSQALTASFQRIQFTPDLLPADITGTTIYNMHTGQFTQKKGPLFANLVLADEINRAPAKVQSALLEAMQERQVTIGETTHKLPTPFLVMATQNPIEQEGTFPLPEAQLDRFMLLVKVGYPTPAEERAMLDRMSGLDSPAATAVASTDDILTARKAVGSIYIDDRVRDYIVHLVSATRDPRGYGLTELAPLVEYGASPRATLCLAAAARAYAFLQHRPYVIPDDIKAIAPDVMRHRIVVTYEAEAEEVAAEDVLRRVFERVPVP